MEKNLDCVSVHGACHSKLQIELPGFSWKCAQLNMSAVRVFLTDSNRMSVENRGSCSTKWCVPQNAAVQFSAMGNFPRGGDQVQQSVSVSDRDASV